jgi:hypothetical protein
MMSRLSATIASAALAGAIALPACTSHSEKIAERSVSPLIGTWTRDGNTPSARGTGGPQFTKLTFAADGTLGANR